MTKTGGSDFCLDSHIIIMVVHNYISDSINNVNAVSSDELWIKFTAFMYVRSGKLWVCSIANQFNEVVYL